MIAAGLRRLERGETSPLDFNAWRRWTFDVTERASVGERVGGAERGAGVPASDAVGESAGACPSAKHEGPHRLPLVRDEGSGQEFIRITDEVAAIVSASGVREGMVLVSAMHITAGVYVNDWEDGLISDFQAVAREARAGRAAVPPSPDRRGQRGRAPEANDHGTPGDAAHHEGHDSTSGRGSRCSTPSSTVSAASAWSSRSWASDHRSDGRGAEPLPRPERGDAAAAATCITPIAAPSMSLMAISSICEGRDAGGPRMGRRVLRDARAVSPADIDSK